MILVVLSYRYWRFSFLMRHLSPSLPAHRAGYLFYGGHFELFYAVIWYLVWPRNARKPYSRYTIGCPLSFRIFSAIPVMFSLWLVNQLCVIVPVNPRMNLASCELLYKSRIDLRLVVYKFVSCSTNIPLGLSAYNPQKLLVYYLNITLCVDWNCGQRDPLSGWG